MVSILIAVCQKVDPEKCKSGHHEIQIASCAVWHAYSPREKWRCTPPRIFRRFLTPRAYVDFQFVWENDASSSCAAPRRARRHQTDRIFAGGANTPGIVIAACFCTLTLRATKVALKQINSVRRVRVPPIPCSSLDSLLSRAPAVNSAAT